MIPVVVVAFTGHDHHGHENFRSTVTATRRHDHTGAQGAGQQYANQQAFHVCSPDCKGCLARLFILPSG